MLVVNAEALAQKDGSRQRPQDSHRMNARKNYPNYARTNKILLVGKRYDVSTLNDKNYNMASLLTFQRRQTLLYDYYYFQFEKK